MQTTKNKSAVITGISSGIGKGIALKLLNKGYLVFGSVRKKEDAEELVKTFPDMFTPLIFDVTDEQSIRQSVKIVEKRLNGTGLGALINNSGIAFGGPLLFLENELIQKHFEVNVFGVIKVTKAFAHLLGVKEGFNSSPGKIINVSSVSGKIGSPFVAPYVGSKHALEGITHSLRRELIPFGVDVISVRPGVVKTPIWNKARGVGNYDNTPYQHILKDFGRHVGSNVKKGLEVEDIAKLVLKIIEKKKPKTGYTISPSPFTTWIAQHLLPDRWLDNIFSKRFKMKPARKSPAG